MVDGAKPRDCAQSRCGLDVVDDLWLGGAIAARHHHGPAHGAKREHVQRRRRQHETERPQAGRHDVGQLQGSVRVEQHDWRGVAPELEFFGGIHTAVAADHVEVAGHQCERLGLAVLGLAQGAHRGFVRGVARELIAA
jgi:hypothetical protein